MYILGFDSSNKSNLTIKLIFSHDIKNIHLIHHFTYVFIIRWTKYLHLFNVILNIF